MKCCASGRDRSILLFTAWKLATSKEEDEFKENIVLVKVRKEDIPTGNTVHMG